MRRFFNSRHGSTAPGEPAPGLPERVEEDLPARMPDGNSGPRKYGGILK